MDFRHKNTSKASWASYYQPASSTPPANLNRHPYHLDPTVQGFQPTGMEVQRYQQLPPTPPPSSQSSAGELVQIRNYVVTSHFAHTKEMIGLQRALEREAQNNVNEIASIKTTVSRDLQTLQAEIEALKSQIDVSNHVGAGTAQRSNDSVGIALHNQVGADFTGSGLADIYLEEAQTMEDTAANLRKQAAQLRGGQEAVESNTMKLLEGAKDLADMSKAKSKTEFACCEIKYQSISELLEHVSAVHHQDQQKISDTSGDATPTHIPARRPKPTAKVEIKLEEPPKSESNKEPWLPLAVRQMPTAQTLNIENKARFSWELINNSLNGHQWSPGFYFISGKKTGPLNLRSYWVLEGDYEPYLPKAPGQHGAKLTAMFNGTELAAGQGPDETNYLNVPVFVRAPGQKEYAYFGNYSQKRFSDRLDYDHVLDDNVIPAEVRKYWAHQLADSSRPEWVTKELVNHLWPKPSYCGPIPSDSALTTPVTTATPDTSSSNVLEKRVMEALKDYAEDLKEWKKEADMKVKHLTADNLLEAFAKADADEEPGLRLWWEYFEFEKYEEKLYDFLVTNKTPQKTVAHAAPDQKMAAAKRTDTEVQPSSDADTVLPISPTKIKRSSGAPQIPNWTSSTVNGHNSSSRPSQQPTQPKKVENKKPAGDLQAAKDFRAEVQKHLTSGKGGIKDGKKPPHLRHAK